MAKYEMDDTKRLMARVQKCLTLANDAEATEGERDNAMRMAHAILAKHNLDLAQCMSTGAEGQATADAAEPRIDHTGTYGSWPWAMQVSMAVAELFFCKYVVSRGKSMHFGTHYFIGRTSNAITAALVAEFVVKSVYSEACKRMRVEKQGYPFIRAFCWGATRTIQQRARALRVSEEQTRDTAAPTTPAAPGTALVLASVYDAEEAANKQYMAKRWAKLGKARPAKGVSDYNALAQGRAYGETVSLRPQIK